MFKLLTTVLITLITFISGAQTSYETKMKETFALSESQKLREAVQLFEHIAKEEESNWIPYYHAAHTLLISAFQVQDRTAAIPMLDKAEEHLNRAKILSPNNVEILLLEAKAGLAKMMTDLQTLAPVMSSKIERMYSQAMVKAPGNPRALLGDAEWKMGKAKYFGTDSKKYCPNLEKALAAFEIQKDSIPFYPKWGKHRAITLVENCNKL